jgi:hypothetical protein
VKYLFGTSEEQTLQKRLIYIIRCKRVGLLKGYKSKKKKKSLPVLRKFVPLQADYYHLKDKHLIHSELLHLCPGWGILVVRE